MQSYTFSLCKQCRRALSRQFHSSPPTARSAKHMKSFGKDKLVMSPNKALMPWAATSQPPRAPTFARSSQNQYQKPPSLTPLTELSSEDIRALLARNLSGWIEDNGTLYTLTSLGFEEGEAWAVLNAYKKYMEDQLSSHAGSSNLKEGEDPWGVLHLWKGEDSDKRAIVNRALTMRLFTFASQPTLEIKGVSPDSLRVLQQANEALDLRFPAEAFPVARLRTRKVFLHVGPTNSGKTYNALRALASARSGVYAGPLRLLAHEVWERLNRGSIRPFDADPETAHLYARECNLITGEEQRIVSTDATLTSCTVEMVNIFKHWGVCVIDEIQMIADPQRGNAWTAAVLGVSADELHLCGEEAAIPVIEALMKETGDELTIKRYERLTPLAVAEKSLEGRWDRIEKGDCIVTFSRSSIFALKRLVESSTGLRCAVAYGRLPPETRSEQAALFNHGTSGYDVMVASDAIGMGLNLKIKRVVFVKLTKYNGVREVPLSLSQIKQIGGRAGRFGEHGDASSTGVVTCFNENDLPVLTEAFETEAPVLRKATVPFHLHTLTRMAQLLPDTFGLKDLTSLLHVAARLGDDYCLPDSFQSFKGMEVIDQLGKDLRLVEKIQFSNCPTTWRYDLEVLVFESYLRRFVTGDVVDLDESLQESHLFSTFESTNQARKEHQENEQRLQLGASGQSIHNMETLAALEALHKVLITYIWLAYRMPVSFNGQLEACRLKEETEKCIEFILEGIQSVKEHRRRHQLQARVKTLSQLRAETSDQKIAYGPKAPRLPLHLRRATIHKHS